MKGSERDLLAQRLKQLRLPSFAAHCERLAGQARRRGWDPLRYLAELAEVETVERWDRRVARLTKQARLPRGKTLQSLDTGRLPAAVRGMLPELCGGGFLRDAVNVLAFGRPGVGKTHVLCAVAGELVRRGHPTLFTSARALTERLAVAKRDLGLNRELQRLDRVQCLLLDDIGYVRQDRAEMEVLFELLAHRYERRSVMLTSNLVFSKWDSIFPDKMTAAAAVDRVVHHSVVLELDIPSYRAEQARARVAEAGGQAARAKAGRAGGSAQSGGTP